MAGLEEEIFESNGISDDKCSLVEEGYWYENDLLLAAELGKTLLERNRDLETQLSAQTKNSNNLRVEIDLLKKQLETLRELNRNKMILYEDVDRNSHELEIVNKNLIVENKKQKEKIKNLSIKNGFLEQQLEECHENLKICQSDLKELRSIMTSGSTEHDDANVIKFSTSIEHNSSYQDYNVICLNCKQRDEKIVNLEIDLDTKINEIEDLQRHIRSLKKKTHLIEVELEDLKGLPQQIKTKIEKKDSLVDDLYSVLEYDIEKVDEKPVEMFFETFQIDDEVGNLNTGEKVFSSTKSLQTMGANTVEIHEPLSLLNELDEKYNNLVKQYEIMLQSSQRNTNNSNNFCDHCSGVTVLDDRFQQKLDKIFSEETRQQRKLLTTQNYKPKYKELFRDAFNLLKDMKETKRFDMKSDKEYFIELKHLPTPYQAESVFKQ